MCECSECVAHGATYTEAFRAQCEALAVARMMDDAARSEYLGMVAQKRGAEDAQMVREAAWLFLRA